MPRNNVPKNVRSFINSLFDVYLEKNAEKQLNDEIRSIKEAIKLEQESQNRRPSSSTYREDNSG